MRDSVISLVYDLEANEPVGWITVGSAISKGDAVNLNVVTSEGLAARHFVVELVVWSMDYQPFDKDSSPSLSRIGDVCQQTLYVLPWDSEREGIDLPD